ncbi:hypothetical protein Tco_0753322 [Tanacetum coccineum]
MMHVLDKLDDEPLVFEEQLVVDMSDDEEVLYKTVMVVEVNRIVEQLVKSIDDIETECCTKIDDCCSKEVTDINKKGKNQAKTDKTEHEIERA